MGHVFQWAGIYIGTMVLGYALKRMGIFKAEEKATLANIVFYITLPAMIISSYSGVEIDFWYLISLALGFSINLTMLLLAGYLARRKSPELQALYMINGCGFNLGNITMPFLNNFYPASIPYLCMFDTGDSFFSLGFSYSAASTRLLRRNCPQKQSRWGSLCQVIKSLLRSVPFDAYLIMTLLSLLSVSLPGPLMAAAQFLGQANGCIVMLMIGISFELRISRDELLDVLTLLAFRYLAGAIFAFIIFRLPAPEMMRMGLSIAMFSSVPNACLIYSNQLCKKSTLANTLNPISTALAIPVMSLVMLILD